MEPRPISKATIIRTVALMLALVNQLLVAFGKSPLPFGEAEIEQMIINIDLAVSSAITLVTSLWAWWKNNDITVKARSK